MIKIIKLGTLAACCMLLTSCLVSQKSCKKCFKVAYSSAPYDAIIVPGIPYGDSSNYNKFVMRSRVYWSYYLYANKITKNIIYSGGAVYTPYKEAEIMKLYAQALGVPDSNVFAETKAEHSTENLFYSYGLARQKGFKKIALATDPFQARLLKKFARHEKLKVDFIPFVYDTLRTMNTTYIPVLDPSSARAKDFRSLPSRESKWQRFRGTLGKKIDYSAYPY